MRSRRSPIVAGVLALVAGMAARASAQPSTMLSTYVLFAQDSLNSRSVTIQDGDVGVNDGMMSLRGLTIAGESDFAADIAHVDTHTLCEDLFTNAPVVGGSNACPRRSGSVPRPIVGDLATACGFPTDAKDCDPSKPVTVAHDQTLPLGPGAYGDLLVQGGGAGPAVLRLSAGDYSFCNVRVSRHGSVVFDGAATVTVHGSSRMSNATYVGPGNGPGAPTAGGIRWFVEGTVARFSRGGSINLYACAPAAKMNIGGGNVLTGRFVARSIRVKKSSITFAPPVPAVCGDAVLSPGEQCDTGIPCAVGTCVACQCQSGSTTTSTTTPTTTTLPGCTTDEDCNPGSPGGTFVCEDGHCVPGCDDDADCNPGSPGGTFVCDDGHCVPGCDDDADCNPGSPGGTFVCEDGHCVPGCDDDADCTSPGGGFVCEDGHCVPSSTTTTTTTTPTSSTHATTTTVTTGTSTTTLHPCSSDQDCPIGVCRDGVCVPECNTDEDCNQGSPGGSFVCRDGRCVAGGEICGDCIDNDGDGLTDFEDPDCCDASAGQLFAMELRKGRVRPRKSAEALLRLKGGLARSGLASMIDPPTNVVALQIESQENGEVLCAMIPAGKFVKAKKGRTFNYSRKKAQVPLELGRNLDRIVIKILKNGQVRYRAKGKHTALRTPPEGTLRITFGFSRPGSPASDNVCSQAVRVFRGGKKGQLRYP